MSDRSESGDRQQRGPGADRGREGFGDDGGTRVGRPDPAQGADQHTGPSSQPVKEGLEGAVFEESGDARGGVSKSDAGAAASRGSQGGAPTGAGAEAAEGTHNAMRDRSPGENSGVDAAADQIERKDDSSRRGSEPLTGRDQEHVSGYGGAGGAPKKSSDQR
jgi:hypothetical protein